MARRRRFTRTFAGKKGSRRFFWFRFTPFTLTLRQASAAVHSDILLEEADYYSPQEALNDAQRGGARLERLIIQFGLSLEAAPAFFQASGSAYLAQIPEFMIWKQSDRFTSNVTSTAGWDSERDNARVLMDQVTTEMDSVQLSSTSIVRETRGEYHTKSKVRLADSALGIAWRGFFDTADANLNGYSDWVRPTMLISTP